VQLVRVPAFLTLIATALLLGGSAASRAAPRPQADQPSLDLYPGSTSLGRVSDTEADVYLPTSTEMAKLVLYIPTGYGLDLTKPNGAHVGEVVAWKNFTSFPEFGNLAAVDPAAYASNTCVPGAHQAVWLLILDDTTQLPPIPVLVDQTSGAETSFGAYKAQLCLPSSAGGTMRIRELDLDFEILTNPATQGAYKWRVLVTPYAGGTPNDAGTFELRATVPLPVRLTLHGRYDRKKKRALLTGQLSSPVFDTGRVFLALYTNSSGFFHYTGELKTDAHGRYSLRRRIKHTTRFGLLTDTYYDCDAGSPAPAGCVSDTLAAIRSPEVKVVVPKRKRK
jgi:hypothetical protein